VLPPAVEEAVAAVASDRESGATRLAERTLRAFDLLASSGRADPAVVRELAHRLQEAQPAMASVRNVARLGAKVLVEAPRDWPAFRESMGRQLEEGRRLAARNFVNLLEGPATILTLSRSANVFECLALAHGKGLIQEVFVLESRPLREGAEFAKDLRAAGVRASAIADEAAGACVGGATLGLAGADTVLADGSIVNRAGTHALAALCRAAGKPFYVVCETFKIGTNPPAPSPLFDLTPAVLVTGIVTERGVLLPQQVRSTAMDWGRESGSRDSTSDDSPEG